MNLHEFAALKPGDEIENAMTHSRGRVTEAKSDGVMVAWGGKALVTFHYSVNSTAWMHWNKAPKECPNGGPCTSDRCEPADQCLGGTKEQYDNLATRAST